MSAYFYDIAIGRLLLTYDSKILNIGIVWPVVQLKIHSYIVHVLCIIIVVCNGSITNRTCCDDNCVGYFRVTLFIYYMMILCWNDRGGVYSHGCYYVYV